MTQARPRRPATVLWRRSDARLVAAGGAVAAGVSFLRARYLRWGSTDEEFNVALPGDDLVPDADLTATRAITVRAPPDRVWPWIAQLGQGHGGFYSYDFLENVTGCDIHSADRIVSEWQAVKVGDEIHLHPEVGLIVAVAQPGRALVLRGGVPIGRTPAPYDFTWAFVLSGQADQTTRLVVRERYWYARPWARLLIEPTELVSFVMSRRMLHGIKQRAEHTVDATSTSAAGEAATVRGRVSTPGQEPASASPRPGRTSTQLPASTGGA